MKELILLSIKLQPWEGNVIVNENVDWKAHKFLSPQMQPGESKQYCHWIYNQKMAKNIVTENAAKKV